MMYQTLLVVFCLVILIPEDVQLTNMESDQEQRDYLRRFGYLDSYMSGVLAKLSSEDTYVTAIKSFQLMAGIEVTGKINNETMEMMKTPRCGVKDQASMANIAKRRKRYVAQGSMWKKSVIKYKFGTITSQQDQTRVKNEIKRAIKLWSDAVPGLSFVEGSPADIDISFTPRQHGDGNDFDGRGTTLAHAFFPQFGGNVHFDEDEKWTIDSYEGTNIFQVAVHELGHSLGLEHSMVRQAIMAPYYRRYVPDAKLHSDDIEGIRYIYKGKEKLMDPNWCSDPKFDAIISVDSVIYAFKGSQFSKLDLKGIVSGYPKEISSEWLGLPNDIDTAVYWTGHMSSNMSGYEKGIYFFKDDNCYLFTSLDNTTYTLKPGYPKNLSAEFPGVPMNSDAAFVWSGNGRLYFIKEKEYYRVSESRGIDEGFPRKLTIWKGLPEKIDSAFFSQRNGRTYFYSGQNFYRFNDIQFKVDVGYPKATSEYWLGCPGALSSNRDTLMMEMAEGGMQFVESSAARLCLSIFTIVLAAIAGLSATL